MKEELLVICVGAVASSVILGLAVLLINIFGR
jgi:hypothetical protein